MPEERDVKQLLKCKLIASRPVGRPKIRWMENVMKGIQAMKIVSWKTCAQARKISLNSLLAIRITLDYIG
jgi:hypothetical protein